MNNNFHSRNTIDIFRIILVLIGIILSVVIIITQLVRINLNIYIILISLGIAGIGAILSTLFANRIAIRIGKEPLAKIFISFSYADKNFVDKLSSALVQQGFEILRADKSILIGEFVKEKILELLNKSDFMIIVISTNSAQSESVLKEVSIFKQSNRQIFPILLQENRQANELEGLIGNIQYVDFNKNFKEGLDKLIYSLEEYSSRNRNYKNQGQ